MTVHYLLMGGGGAAPSGLRFQGKYHVGDSNRVQIGVGMYFKPDGTKVYIQDGGFSKSAAIFEYDLATPWTVTTMTFSQTFVTVSGVRGMAFKPDGSMFFVLTTSDRKVHAYVMTTPWDISTATLLTSITLDSVDIGTNPTGLAFKSDGGKLYIIGFSPNKKIYEYSLLTDWDVTTAVFAGGSSVNFTNSFGMAFTGDGSTLFITEDGYTTTDEYTLSTPWATSTMSYSKTLEYPESPQRAVYNYTLASSPSGGRFYTQGTDTGTVATSYIYQYGYGEMPTASGRVITLPATLDVSSTNTLFTDAFIYFNPSTEMLEATNETGHQWLVPAGDISAYEARLVWSSGSVPDFGTLTSWQPLSDAVSWSWLNGNPGTIKSFTGTLEVRRIAFPDDMDSCPITVTVTTE